MKPCRLLLALTLAMTVLGACYQSPDIAYHEPGVYEGATDPLLAKEASPDQQKILRERLLQVQADR